MPHYLHHGTRGRQAGVGEDGEPPLPLASHGDVDPVPETKKTSSSSRGRKGCGVGVEGIYRRGSSTSPAPPMSKVGKQEYLVEINGGGGRKRQREVTSALPRNAAGISRSPEHLALSSRACRCWISFRWGQFGSSYRVCPGSVLRPVYATTHILQSFEDSFLFLTGLRATKRAISCPDLISSLMMRPCERQPGPVHLSLN
jgi:hypothetical protein